MAIFYRPVTPAPSTNNRRWIAVRENGEEMTGLE